MTTVPACHNPLCRRMPIADNAHSFGYGYVGHDEEKNPDCWQFSSPCWVCAEAHLKQHPTDAVWPKGPVQPRVSNKYKVNPKGRHVATGHTQPHLEVRNITMAEHDFIVGLVTCRHTDDDRYQLSRAVDAFLQGNSDDWILVEFWTQDFAAIQRWEDWLNANYPQECVVEKSK